MIEDTITITCERPKQAMAAMSFFKIHILKHDILRGLLELSICRHCLGQVLNSQITKDVYQGHFLKHLLVSMVAVASNGYLAPVRIHA